MPNYFELFPRWDDGKRLGPGPDYWATNAPAFNTSTTAGATLDGLVATMKKLKPPPRDVFVFGGSMADFKAALEAGGVEVRAGATVDPGMPCSPFGATFPPLFSLGCYEVDGAVWVAADYRDVEDAREGKLPFKRIGGKANHG